MSQTTQRTQERLGRPGQPAQAAPPNSITRIAEGAMRPGDLAIRGDDSSSSGKGARPLAAAAAADADGIVVSLASTAGTQTISGAGLDGAIGGDLMLPGRNLEFVFDGSTDWDPTTITVTGEDENGDVITEDFAVATSTTTTGSKTFRRVTSIAVPAQTGTGGTATVGTGTLLGPLTSADVLGMVRYLAARETAEGATAEFAQYDVLAIVREGLMWVEVEEAVADGERVFVRLVTSGAEAINGYRNDRDGTAAAPDCVPVKGMRFHGDSESRDGVIMAVVSMDLLAG